VAKKKFQLAGHILQMALEHPAIDWTVADGRRSRVWPKKTLGGNTL